MMDRERKWKIHFHDLDKNNCGELKVLPPYKWYISGGKKWMIQNEVCEDLNQFLRSAPPAFLSFKEHNEHNSAESVF